MRRMIAIVLMVVLCFSLTACGKSEAAKKVDALILEIGEVTAEREDAVIAAETAYAALNEEEKSEVENYPILTTSRKELDEALYEKRLEELYTAVYGEWVNVNDMDSYVFGQNGTGTHGEMSIEYTIDPENMLLSVVEGVANITARDFSIDLESSTPKLTPEDAVTYYVEAENYDTIAQQIREEYTDILTSYEYWSNTQGLNYIMFAEYGGGWFLLSGTTLDMRWTWEDNNTIKVSFEYDGTTYSNILTIINTNEGPRMINDQNIVQYIPKNKLK